MATEEKVVEVSIKGGVLSHGRVPEGVALRIRNYDVESGLQSTRFVHDDSGRYVESIITSQDCLCHPDEDCACMNVEE